MAVVKRFFLLYVRECCRSDRPTRASMEKRMLNCIIDWLICSFHAPLIRGSDFLYCARGWFHPPTIRGSNLIYCSLGWFLFIGLISLINIHLITCSVGFELNSHTFHFMSKISLCYIRQGGITTFTHCFTLSKISVCYIHQGGRQLDRVSPSRGVRGSRSPEDSRSLSFKLDMCEKYAVYIINIGTVTKSLVSVITISSTINFILFFSRNYILLLVLYFVW